MKSKNGFTLVELLAVVAILSLLVIIALPNIIDMFNDAKKNSFLTECKEILKTANQQWMSDSMVETDERIYERCDGCTGKELSLGGRQEIDYYVKLNKAGKVVRFIITDGTYQYVYDGDDLVPENVTTAVAIADINPEDKITITPTGIEGYDEPSYFDDQFCVFIEGGGTTITKEYYPFKSGMTWDSFQRYLSTGNDLEGYTFTLTEVWDSSFHRHLPGESDFNTYLNDPNSTIYYTLKYRGNQSQIFYRMDRYGNCFETLDGFGATPETWDYYPFCEHQNLQINSATQGCYSPGWG